MEIMYKDLKKLMEKFFKYKNACDMNNPQHEKILKYFCNFCEISYPGAPTLSQKMIDKWCEKRDTESAASRNARIGILIAFVKYLNKHCLSTYTIPERIKNARSNHIPHSFTKDELTRFFYQCDNLPKINESRMNIKRLVVPTLFRLLYSTGMRPIEARSLLREDVLLRDGVIRINKSKGGSQHYVALHSSMISILEKYDSSINRIIPNRKFFFESSVGKQFDTRWIIRTFHQIWTKANGNKKKVIPYDFRHNYAITNINRWQNDGFDFNEKMLFLSKSMGHCSIEATLHYYSLVPRLATTIRNNTEDDFNNIIPEVNYEKGQ